jgi:hypothetical protein
MSASASKREASPKSFLCVAANSPHIWAHGVPLTSAALQGSRSLISRDDPKPGEWDSIQATSATPLEVADRSVLQFVKPR